MPPFLILTTVGTSALQRDKLEGLGLFAQWDPGTERLLPKGKDAGKGDALIEQLQSIGGVTAFIDNYLELVQREIGLEDNSITRELRNPKITLSNRFSAEFSSLYLLLSRPELEISSVKVTLLLSDSPEGALCGLINQRLIQRKYGLESELKVVNGLQTENFEEFYNTGLQSFLELVSQQGADYRAERVWLNITGGFKSLIPYCTYLSFAYDHPLYFVFEEQPVPVGINLNQFKDFSPTDEGKIRDVKTILRRMGSEFPMSANPHPSMGTPDPP
ncbi:MAG: hypothetical protein ACE5Q6_08990 [Dehalococcoidia bacterium]